VEWEIIWNLIIMQNGKGSKSRITDKKKFDAHFDEIEWRSKKDFCADCGQTFESYDATYKDDAGNYYHVDECYTNYN
jgi:hypothetical protein